MLPEKWELSDLEERMEKVEDRYNRQFLAMQKIIDEMNSTKEGLINSLEYLPFTNKDWSLIVLIHFFDTV